jgi:hypothetical protein
MSHSSNRNLKIIYYSLTVVAVLCLLIFGANSSKLGGDAINGKTENGHYFVGGPSGYTEVTYPEYRTNKIIGITLLIIWPITMIGLFYVDRGRLNVFGKRLKQR